LEIPKLVAVKFTVYVPCGVTDVAAGGIVLPPPLLPPPQPIPITPASKIAGTTTSLLFLDLRKPFRSPQSGSKTSTASHETPPTIPSWTENRPESCSGCSSCLDQ
jgi:hypothetical protein